MIHLNGFPCLEGEDHLHGLAVGAVMAGQTDGVRLANKTHEVGFSTSSEDSNSNSTALALPQQLPLHELKLSGNERNADLTKTIIGRDRNHFKEFRKRE
ncbi:hypothetical protein Pst134EA_007437 [Puccinia striiformis f. sp. tritici]|uniref:uncharacterized protein n=1 Tax=Puccinia striiformis f. sp. tritici TaxID=168172 RepID=UPI00200880A2|nr:uncharacterized protein Pst134EA_031282 [Puccinia striiformis f. sp. tritici]XP_047809626.1 hypothetical protein Pst134EA_007437 [Puccinia striiformis f. sp. tritici]KAH9443406.1 hypothetical protein Pst134EA_031282 [Puccinia striiformis f. sp. tritici]KAH9470172.1 hypothetical protein Pst134EA_007437 [Puccinia striiformis f. sp. tritici]